MEITATDTTVVPSVSRVIEIKFYFRDGNGWTVVHTNGSREHFSAPEWSIVRGAHPNRTTMCNACGNLYDPDTRGGHDPGCIMKNAKRLPAPCEMCNDTKRDPSNTSEQCPACTAPADPTTGERDIYYVWPTEDGYAVKYAPPVGGGPAILIATCPSAADALFIADKFNSPK